MDDADEAADGGTVVAGSSPRGQPTPIDRLRSLADDGRLIVAATAVGLFVLPFFLVEVLGMVASMELGIPGAIPVGLIGLGAVLMLAPAFSDGSARTSAVVGALALVIGSVMVVVGLPVALDRIIGGLLVLVGLAALTSLLPAEGVDFSTLGIGLLVAGMVVGVFSLDIGIGGYEGLASIVLAFGVVVVGFNLLLGYVGLLSFGHAAFFGTAAYAAAMIATPATFTVPVVDAAVAMPNTGSPLLMVLVGVVVATLLAWPIGFLSIRRSGVYFAVLTLTFGQMLYFYALSPGSWLTRGSNGFSISREGGEINALLGQFPLREASFIPAATWEYAFAALLTLAAVALAYRIINSPYGLIFKALGENEQRVEFVGLNVFRYKLMAFIISGAFAGAGGALYAIHETFIQPNDVMYWITSGDFVIMTILGGVGTLLGPLFGALAFEYIFNVISGVELPVIGPVGSLWRFALGAVFVIIVWAFPEGIWGGIRAGLARLVRAVERAVFDTGDGPVADDVEEPGGGGDD
jgi:branched-chain amino acid transport system permease protein